MRKFLREEFSGRTFTPPLLLLARFHKDLSFLKKDLNIKHCIPVFKY